MQLRRDDGYEIDTAEDRLDLTQVHRWLSTDAYWALGRSFDVVATAVRHSLCFGLYGPDARLVGFARAVTDRATFAWICDVYVEPASRGLGLGTWLSGTATEYLLDHGLRRVVLATRDAHEVYAKAGFEPLSRPDRWLEIFRDPPPPARRPMTQPGDVAHT